MLRKMKPEDDILGNFRQGLITKAEAISFMANLGHEDAGEIVAEWQDKLEWEEIEADHRKAAGE